MLEPSFTSQILGLLTIVTTFTVVISVVNFFLPGVFSDDCLVEEPEKQVQVQQQEEPRWEWAGAYLQQESHGTFHQTLRN